MDKPNTGGAVLVSAASAAVLFPGQGSHAPAMGAPWQGTAAWEIVERAEAALGRPLARSLADPHQPPETTTDIQLSVLLTSLMAWHAADLGGEAPLAFAGHSLGQITALAAAGVLTVEQAARLVAVRGEVAERACAAAPGGMVAVLGTADDTVAAACRSGGAWIANDNAPGQLVIAGSEPALAATQEHLTRMGGRKLIRLRVPGAFHTPLMAPAAEEFAAYLRGVRFAPAAGPIIRNADARPAPSGTDWAADLAAHLTRPVLWRDTQEHLARMGATILVEAGHGTTLTSIARRTVPGLRLANIGAPAAPRPAATAIATA